jgi:threonine/homoserine/homoserine lactone efflux protein
MLAFSALAVVIIAVPGPSVLFITSRALEHGRRAAIITAVGNTVGVFLHVVLVAAGVGAIVAASATAFTVLKVAGGAYLVFLGVQAIRHRRRGIGEFAKQGETDPSRVDVTPGSRRLWADAFTVGALNPKTMVFLAAVIPPFVNVGVGPAWLQMLVLGLVFNAMSILLDSVYALGVSGARSQFMRSPGAVSRLRAGGGVIMAGLGVALLASRRTA